MMVFEPADQNKPEEFGSSFGVLCDFQYKWQQFQQEMTTLLCDDSSDAFVALLMEGKVPSDGRDHMTGA